MPDSVVIKRDIILRAIVTEKLKDLARCIYSILSDNFSIIYNTNSVTYFLDFA